MPVDTQNDLEDLLSQVDGKPKKATAAPGTQTKSATPDDLSDLIGQVQGKAERQPLTRLQADTQLSQLGQPTGSFDQQQASPRLPNFLQQFESPQEAYVNEPARKIARIKDAAGTIGPQKLYPSGKADVPKPPMLPQFIKNLLPDQQVDVPESVNTFLGGLKGQASQLPVNDGVTVNDALNHASELYEDVAHKPHLPLGEFADRYIASGAPTTGRVGLFGDRALRGVANAAEPFTSVENLALAGAGIPGGPAVSKVASAYFADQALTGLENNIGDIVQGKVDPVQGIASGLVNFGIARGALGHAMATEGVAPVEPKRAETVRQEQVAPQQPMAQQPRAATPEPGSTPALMPEDIADLHRQVKGGTTPYTQLEQRTGQPRQLSQLDVAQGVGERRQPKNLPRVGQEVPGLDAQADAMRPVEPRSLSEPAFQPEDIAPVPQSERKAPKFNVGDSVPAMISREQLADISRAGFTVDEGGRIAEKGLETPRVGQEVPGLDQQADAMRSPVAGHRVVAIRTDGLPVVEPIKGGGGSPMGEEGAKARPGANTAYSGLFERRSDSTLRKQVSEMSPEEKDAALLGSDLTGLPNRRAFQESERNLGQSHPHVGYADLDDFHNFNSKLTHEGVDQVALPAIGDLYNEAAAQEAAGSIHVYHRSGDEFLMRASDPEAIDRVNQRVREQLATANFEYVAPDGRKYQQKGIGLSYGQGANEVAAEESAKRNKAERKAAGLREGARDAEVPGIASEGQPLDQNNPSGRASVQRPVERVSTAKQNVSLASRDTISGEYGADTSVKTPTSSLPAKYKLVEADSLIPSHNAESFALNRDYPAGVQERAYHTSKEAQARVIQQAQNYQPEYTVNTNPDAVNGPPVVTPDGTVLGGNSRTMSTQRIYLRDEGQAYRDYLKRNASQFGLDPAKVDELQKPVLVREVPQPANVEEARRVGSELNKSMTGALGVSERAVSAGKSIKPETLQNVSAMVEAGDYSTLRELMRDRGRELVAMLTRDGVITDRERPQFVDTATGGLSDEGKTFVENALLGSVVDDPVLMDRVPKSTLNKLDGSLADIASVSGRTDEYNILPLVRAALSEHAEAAARGMDIETYLRQRGMFEPDTNPAVQALARALAGKTKEVRQSFREFAKDSNVDKQGQGFLMILQPPSAVRAFNHAFHVELTDHEFAGALLDVLGKSPTIIPESPDGRSNPPSQTLGAGPAGVQLEATQREDSGGPARTGSDKQRGGTAEHADSGLPPSSDVDGGPTLGAHTPISLAYEAAKRINRFYDDKIAEPTIQNILKLGRTHGDIEKIDPELARSLRLLDNAPSYFKQRAKDIVTKLTGGLTREQERSFVLMADEASRENLKENHHAEYMQAVDDPKVQAALKAYKPEEEKLRQARKAMGGTTIDTDYLRRVYEQHTAGIGKKATPGGKGEHVEYNRAVVPERTDKNSREATPDYYYENGLHEFGPSFGTKYVATMLKFARDKVAREFIAKATRLEPHQNIPRSIEYNGKTYYSPSAAAEMRDAGKKNVPRFSWYDDTEGLKYQSATAKYLGPRDVVDTLRSYDSSRKEGSDSFKRFFREQIIGFGLGVPHAFNIFRRVTQSFPGGAVNPLAWAKATKTMFSADLKRRALSGTEDPQFDRLMKQGGISSSGVSSFKEYAGGNFNPANWARVFAKVGHDWLFKQGGFDQRARLYVADLVKSQRPSISDERLTQLINEQLGNYNRVNWTKVQQQVSKFQLFPGWDNSSIAWVLRHPIKTTVPPALLVLMANNVVNQLGQQGIGPGNRDSDRFDLTNVHIGDRSYGTSLVREGIANKLGAPAIAYAQAKLQNKGKGETAADVTASLKKVVRAATDMVRPDFVAPFEVVMNKELRGGEIVKSGDLKRPGKYLPNKAAEDYAVYFLKKAIPEFDRILGSENKPDLASIFGGNFGVYNYPDDAERRLRLKVGKVAQSQIAMGELKTTDPASLKKYYDDNPETAVYMGMGSQLRETLTTLKKLDQTKELIENGKYSSEQKKSALAAIEKARGAELRVADKLDRATDEALATVRHRKNIPSFLRPRPQAENTY